MSGPFGVTGWSSLIRLLLLHLCLPWNLVTGVTHHLRCVNDYVLTINCSLSMVPSEYPSDNNYWLRLKKFYGEKFDCMLTKTSGDYFCSVKIHNVTPDHDDYYALTFSDLDIFVISLCRKKSELENCDRLDKEYRPSMNIKPNAPCCLTVSHNSSQCHFSWKGAEEYRFTGLTKTLMYQLQYFKTGDNNDTSPQEINTENVSYSVGDEEFESGTQYTGRVRSSPNQASYKGQWSDWSGEVHWRIESTGKGLPSKPFVFGLEKVIITLCVIMMFLVLLGYALIKKWKQRAFIPTPARYFDTLYSDFQGDFKWRAAHTRI
ncbi:interleukin-21 receptor isoform X2 [Antennarius striatus]|uniref:interleukin-21 receptor isoform X2 n=1 Tax=Antennarius striatus TaxID=241820 RepID=UPI0035B3D496